MRESVGNMNWFAMAIPTSRGEDSINDLVVQPRIAPVAKETWQIMVSKQ